MKELRFILTLTLLLINTCLFSQEGTVLSLPVTADGAKVRDPQQVTMKSGFKAGGGLIFKACIGDSSYTPATPTADIVTYPDVSLVMPDQNFIRTTTFIKPFLADVHNYQYLMDDISVDVQYFDGLGRLTETVGAYGSPLQNDVVQYMEYDSYGRNSVQHMPYEGSNKNGAYIADPGSAKASYYQREFSDWGNDITKTYSKTIYENSPLNRVIQQGAPGVDWQPESHPIQYEYLTNSTAIDRFQYTGDTYTTTPPYAANTLYLIKTYDEDGKATLEYKDFEGKVVCKTVEGSGSRTLYCYDEFGLLRCVIPPKASAPDVNPAQHNLCFYYKYDARKRLIKKKLPDADWLYMIYDSRDRLVLTQDGNQRSGSDKWWNYSLYDDLNRQVETGDIILTESFETLTTSLQADINFIRDYTYSTKHPSIYTYYDQYTGFTVYPFAADGIVSSSDLAESNKGRIMGKRVKISGASPDADLVDFAGTTYYYDKLGRLIQEVSHNHLDRRNCISYQYNFAGQVIRSRNLDQTTDVNYFDLIYSYDHRGRMLKTKMIINGGDEVIVSENRYNAINSLTTKLIHSRKVSNTFNPFLQKIDYKYNIRGWLTAINDPSFTENDGDRYGMSISYNHPLQGSHPSYNGNISAIQWSANANVNFTYDFEYDQKNQLLFANFSKPNLNAYAYNESYQYDNNGNIYRLIRHDKDTIIDDITNYYDYGTYGNTIRSSYDNAKDRPDLPDYPGSNASNTFLYDLNGNLTVEPHREFQIQYNRSNLPVLFSTGLPGEELTIDNYFTEEGKKVRKTLTEGDYPTITDYCGPFVYNEEDATRKLSYILMPEGRVVNTAAAGLTPDWEWQYNLTDHLGNVRIVIKGDSPNNAVVCQENHYYPFGMLMADIGSTYPDYNLENVTQPYLYNGKEYNPELELNWYDYGARFYDPALGRWHVIDNKVEKFSSITPYAYAVNNPIIFLDPNGNDIVYFNMNGDEVSRTNSTTEFRTYVGSTGNYSEASMPKIIKGYESPIYQKYDYNIAAQTYIFNNLSCDQRPTTSGGESFTGATPSDLDPTLVKAMIVEETGAGTIDGEQGQQGKSDIMQANVSTTSGQTDWSDSKKTFGLEKDKSATPNQSLYAGTRILYTKGLLTTDIKDKNGKVIGYNVTWRGSNWNSAVRRYNGGGNTNYLEEVLNYLNNALDPSSENYYEPEKKKK